MLWSNSDVCCGFVYQIADTEIGKFPILDTTVTPAGAIDAVLQTTARRASKPQQERLGTFASVSLAKAECQHVSFDHCGVTPVQRSLHTEPVRTAAATRPSMPSPSANPHAPKFNLHILAAVAEFERRHQQAHHGKPSPAPTLARGVRTLSGKP